MSKIICVVARSKVEACEFARCQRLRRGQWKYIGSEKSLRGMPRGSAIWHVGDWREHPNSIEIEQLAAAIGMVEWASPQDCAA